MNLLNPEFYLYSAVLCFDNYLFPYSFYSFGTYFNLFYLFIPYHFVQFWSAVLVPWFYFNLLTFIPWYIWYFSCL